MFVYTHTYTYICVYTCTYIYIYVCVCVCVGMRVCAKLLQYWFFETPWTVACQASLSTGFSRQEYWSELPCPPPGHLLDPGMEPTSLTSLALAGDSLSLVPGRFHACMLCLVAQSCLTLCDPMDHSPSGSSVQGEFPGKNAGVGCHALLQGIFSTQGSNPGLLHCRWIFYHLSHQGSLKYWYG